MIKSRCLVCGGGDIVFYGGAGRDYPLAKCQNCSLVFASLTPASIEKIYSQKYYVGLGVKGGYYNYFEESVVNKLTFKHRLNKILSSFKSKKISLLDIGCGLGDFLEVARTLLVSRYIGTEISPFALSNCRKKGLEIYPVSSSFSEKFDVVTVQDVVEHFADPLGELKKTYKLLKRGGLLFLTTPNIESISAKVFESHWYHYKSPEHLFYFSPKTIKLLLEKAGFENVVVKPTLSWVSIRYLVERLTFYFPKFDGLINRLSDNAICKIAFPIYTGEIEVWARKKDSSIMKS